jgi:hypothetical protein
MRPHELAMCPACNHLPLTQKWVSMRHVLSLQWASLLRKLLGEEMSDPSPRAPTHLDFSS